MKRALYIIVITLVAALFAGQAFASAYGVFSTDRFGYTGTVKRYGSLADAQAGTNQVGDDIAIGNRDLSVYIVNGMPSYDTNMNVIMGSWWYSTEGSAGYGNVRGNSGRGFLQLYDEDASTDNSLDMTFGNYDGSYWTEFSLNIAGADADYPNDYARFWIDYQGSGADMVYFHTYDLSVTAYGLQGVQTAPGLIEAGNHPTNVLGSFSGIFENVSTTYPANNGFYAFELTLDMVNWAWENRDDLDPYEFADSYFAESSPVPVPAAVWLLGSGLAGLLALRRKLRS